MLPCGQLQGRADLLALVCDLYCNYFTFPLGILGQVYYLIVSIPDSCCLSYFLIIAPIVCGGSVFAPCFVIQFIVSFIFCIHKEKELIALLKLSSKWHVSQYAVALPYGDVGCSEVCDFGISSYLFPFVYQNVSTSNKSRHILL